jgi:hypothetical protein
MKIKLIKQYGVSTAGTILDPDKNIAELLIGRGIAEPVQDEIIQAAATIGMPLETRTIQRNHKRRKRK